MYGQMIRDTPECTTYSTNCTNFCTLHSVEEELFHKAMKFVIVALTHWTDITDNNVDRYFLLISQITMWTGICLKLHQFLQNFKYHSRPSFDDRDCTATLNSVF